MNSNQISKLEYTIETIEKHMDQPLNLNDLSKKVGLSKFHLQRLFKALVDKSLMAYIRGRRLSNSLHDLLHTNMNILDIAVKYQFDYEQSFIRAFQNRFHITPAKYRKLRHELPIEQKIDITTLTGIEQGFIIQPRMVIKPGFYIQGIMDEIFHEQNMIELTTNRLAMLFHKEYLPIVPNKVHEHVYLAIVEYRPVSTISNDYIPCVETSIINTVNPPFVTRTIPSQEYAVFRYVGFHSPYELTYKTMKEFYDYTDYWVMSTKLKQAQNYHFERMDLSICREDYCEMDIYIPIRTENDTTYL
ncbi:helix-turn-helix domain-containing protein [Mobilitalea sibirica]|uniref:Helix-turn-helix domain-containing protein n=2 Tax=Mobilitalea sibirica TaxID=1462919 RepID=A0A8J7H8P7_9FIRM|nr:helix-turn-helix domain-containing protein [Mobilitalea sibirica]